MYDRTNYIIIITLVILLNFIQARTYHSFADFIAEEASKTTTIKPITMNSTSNEVQMDDSISSRIWLFMPCIILLCICVLKCIYRMKCIKDDDDGYQCFCGEVPDSKSSLNVTHDKLCGMEFSWQCCPTSTDE
ncbi:unnamed protein product [Adineta steineri]|uniref:Uncharacterized protein n=1 Tax=Adineta steineri TaxID=433720 RepID=A0A819XQA4_9BILA|nr:unnamed protein product [Adineta steineri]CAF4146278.1 unnamed protein product [Adineta steineri]